MLNNLHTHRTSCGVGMFRTGFRMPENAVLAGILAQLPTEPNGFFTSVRFVSPIPWTLQRDLADTFALTYTAREDSYVVDTRTQDVTVASDNLRGLIYGAYALLQQVQDIYGYVPPEALSAISERCQVPLARLTGIISFYAQFRLQPPGKYQILIWNGTACHVNNAAKIAEAVAKAVRVMEGKVSADGLFYWEKVACLGCCSLAPAMMINDEVFGRLKPADVPGILQKFRDRG